MTKIPVRDSIRYGYAFTFGHLGTIIGLIWAPMVVLAVAGYFVMSHYYGAVPDAVSAGNPVAVGQSGLLVMGWSVVSLLLSSVMYVAVARQALGLREGPAVVHFSLGVPELRVFASMLGLFAILMLFLLIDLAVLGAVHALAGKAQAMRLVAAVIDIAGLLAILYAMLRFSFLLIPATVAEGKVGIARSWQLAAGNFWRIFAVGAATLGPILLVAFAAEVAILGPGFFAHTGGAASGDKAQQMRDMAEQMRQASAHLPWLYGLSFMIAPFLIGLALAPAAFAYRALTAQGSANSGFHNLG